MANTVIKVGIAGISGYSGAVLLDLLLGHKNVRVTYTCAQNTHGQVNEILPQLANRTSLICEKIDLKKAAELCDLVFLAVPHATAMELVPELLKNKVGVIDLSGDYRLKSTALYQKWYGTEHKDPQNLAKAVYGLPELFREKIKKSSFISNPGCYPTAALLGLAPLVATYSKEIDSIIIDAKSGVSGAGKKLTANTMFCEVNENFKAYKVLNHQHSPEIELYLSKVSSKPITVTFVPHLLPINRGIFETIYVQPTKKMNLNTLHSLYKKFYKTEPFVRVLPEGQLPELKNVNYTNFCDIGLSVSENKDMIVITSAIDNLVKGAAGQAVQNMNIMCDFKEDEGLL